jgi:hypothetical protein
VNARRVLLVTDSCDVDAQVAYLAVEVGSVHVVLLVQAIDADTAAGIFIC